MRLSDHGRGGLHLPALTGIPKLARSKGGDPCQWQQSKIQCLPYFVCCPVFWALIHWQHERVPLKRFVACLKPTRRRLTVFEYGLPAIDQAHPIPPSLIPV